MDVNCCVQGLALIERHLGSSSRIGTEERRSRHLTSGLSATRKLGCRSRGKFRIARDPGAIYKMDAKWSFVNPSGLCDVWFPLHVVAEIIEHTNDVAIKIGDHKLAQLPRFVVGLGNDLRLRGLPLCEEFVHLSLAVEIEPEKNRAYVAVRLS